MIHNVLSSRNHNFYTCTLALFLQQLPPKVSPTLQWSSWKHFKEVIVLQRWTFLVHTLCTVHYYCFFFNTLKVHVHVVHSIVYTFWCSVYTKCMFMKTHLYSSELHCFEILMHTSAVPYNDKLLAVNVNTWNVSLFWSPHNHLTINPKDEKALSGIPTRVHHRGSRSQRRLFPSLELIVNWLSAVTKKVFEILSNLVLFLLHS